MILLGLESNLKDRESEFSVLLFSMYSGARIKSVCQITLHDILGVIPDTERDGWYTVNIHLRECKGEGSGALERRVSIQGFAPSK